MKKLLALLIAFMFVFVLVGCDTETTVDTNKLAIEVLQEQNIALQEQINDLQPTQYDRFLEYLFASDGGFIFIELDIEYTEVVDAYGWSDTYVFETNGITDYELSVLVDNDLELKIYTDFASGDYDSFNLVKPLFGTSPKKFTVECYSEFLIIEFESWDNYVDSTVTLSLSVLEEWLWIQKE